MELLDRSTKYERRNTIIKLLKLHVTLWAAAALLLGASFPARADLITSSVTGSLTYLGGSTNYWNGPSTVQIGPGVEFSYSDPLGDMTANFSGSALTVAENGLLSRAGFTETFTDSAFAGLSVIAADSGLNYSLVGNTLTVSFSTPATNYSGNITFGPSAVPEPSLTILLVAALGGMVLLAGRFRRVSE
jgi:hypothetical protein